MRPATTISSAPSWARFKGSINSLRKLVASSFFNVADYLDGLPFARKLLVAGLTQGPLVIPATVRGTPDDVNRAEYALNWNLRLARNFPIPGWRMRFSADLLNVTNSGNRIQENAISGPKFQSAIARCNPGA